MGHEPSRQAQLFSRGRTVGTVLQVLLEQRRPGIVDFSIEELDESGITLLAVELHG
jgi:hypothetical protein